MKEKAKKLSKKIIFAIVAAAIIVTIGIACIGMQIAFVVADGIECYHPEYEQVDLNGILGKDELSDEDYGVLYTQTGLTKAGVDRALLRGEAGKKRILDIQKSYFKEYEVINEYFCPYICQDKINEHASYVYLENGDIIVSSSTHFSGWRIGHAGLVTNAANNKVLQASAVGEASAVGSVRDFTNRVTFMILSPKAAAETKAEVVDYAVKNLEGKIYDPTAGVFSSKNKVDKTQCAHLVWHAYNQFGIDLDSTGGPVVTPKDIANSPYVEVVQVFGFDPVKLWK